MFLSFIYFISIINLSRRKNDENKTIANIEKTNSRDIATNGKEKKIVFPKRSDKRKRSLKIT